MPPERRGKLLSRARTLLEGVRFQEDSHFSQDPIGRVEVFCLSNQRKTKGSDYVRGKGVGSWQF